MDLGFKHFKTIFCWQAVLKHFFMDFFSIFPIIQMRFAIIGSNFISDKFIEAGSLVEGFELAAVYSRTETRAQEFAVR